jgi:hypothetical protein
MGGTVHLSIAPCAAGFDEECGMPRLTAHGERAAGAAVLCASRGTGAPRYGVGLHRVDAGSVEQRPCVPFWQKQGRFPIFQAMSRDNAHITDLNTTYAKRRASSFQLAIGRGGMWRAVCRRRRVLRRGRVVLGDARQNAECRVTDRRRLAVNARARSEGAV